MDNKSTNEEKLIQVKLDVELYKKFKIACFDGNKTIKEGLTEAILQYMSEKNAETEKENL